jgi:hypothetical protein
VIVCFVDIGGIVDNHFKQSPLNNDGQQFNQYQQRKQSRLISDGQQFNQYQQRKQSRLNSDGQQFHQ